MFKKIDSLLPQALTADRHAVRREILRIKRWAAKSPSDERINKQLAGLEKKVQASAKKRLWRKANRPEPVYNPALPILAKKDQIIASILKNQVIIISGETGSGKTTQIPKFCLAAGRGIDGKIGCTQPRRIAAVTVSRRIAEELGEGLGRSVGYKIRFKDNTSPNAFVKIMTDGILLAETQSDPYLNEYDTLIIDEAHERSLNIDFILGILKTLLKRRKDLKLIITSATIDTEKFSKAFDNAPVIEVSGRTYPVEVRYSPMEPKSEDNDDPTHMEMAVRITDRLLNQTVTGDILVFMPTEQDIRETCELINGRKHKNTVIFPLFARLAAAEQSRIFSNVSGRKIIVATNIAETSLTIPGIKYVIDSGLARISRYTPKSRTTALPVTAISKSSADQRKGRCGRVENGVCIRLYSEEDFENRPLFTPPEILRSNLAEVILRMTALKLGNISDFPFIDTPASKSIQDGLDLLTELDALVPESNQKTNKKQRPLRLTEKGRFMARLPVDPRLSRMLMDAQVQGCLKEMTVIASALSIQDPRERPAEKAEAADRVQKVFHDPFSDFLTLLNVWEKYHQTWEREKTTGSLKRFCKTHFLSFKRMREWRDIHAQLSEVLKEYGLENNQHPAEKTRVPNNTSRPPRNAEPSPKDMEFSPRYAAIHTSILSGFLSNIAMKKEENIYHGTKGKEVMIFPGSALFNRSKKWIVAAEMVETSRLFARTCANIDSAWLEKLGGGLCKYTYLHPHWERKRGEVVASEQVSLFGLIIIPGRPVSYGRINPDHATEIFIQSALIEGDVQKKLPFMLHNQNLIDDVRDMEDRIRRRDILVGDADLFEFYRKRLQRCYNLKTLARRLKQKDQDRFLRMTPEDIARYRPEDKELSQFPSSIDLGDRSFDCTYRFEPGETDDGVTIRIPSSSAHTVPSESIDWLVPGLYREKITALVKGLPKTYRKRLVPVSDTVDVIVGEMPKTKSALITALGDFIFTRFGVDIPASAWPDDRLPDHLKMRVSITGPKGEEICSARNPAILSRRIPNTDETGESKEMKSARKNWERTGITRWDFPDLPESIVIQGKNRAQWAVYPGLQTADGKEESVSLRLFRNLENALASHKKGVGALFAVHFSKDLKFLKKALVLPKNIRKMADYFGGAKSFEERMYRQMIRRLFHENIRSKAAFYAHAESVASTLLSKGREFANLSVLVLEAYHETRSIFYNLETAHKNNRGVLDFLKGQRAELARLVPDTFMDLYDTDRLIHLPRYLRAAAIRAERAVVNLEKDQTKAKEIEIFSRSLDTLLQELSPAVSERKKAAIEAYFWLIEEYKVSVFAQELKTPVRVSKKRLEETLRKIERMA